MTDNKKTKPNILFLLIDSLRADKCYSENRTCVTPNLDKIVKKNEKLYFKKYWRVRFVPIVSGIN